jgi:O-antigen biosynthesis protein WbqV
MGLRRRQPGGAVLSLGSTSVLIYLHDLGWAAVSMMLALKIRYHFEAKVFPWPVLPRATLVFTLICALVFPAFRLHRGLWRYTAANDLVRICKAVAVANLLLLPALFLQDRLLDFPRSVPIIDAPLLILGLAFGRVLTEAATQGDFWHAFRFEDRSRPPAVVVGAAGAAARYLKAIRSLPAPRPRVAGVVVLDRSEGVGRTLQGAEILGDLAGLTPVLKSLKAGEGRDPQVILAEPRPDRALLQAVIASAGEAGARVVTIRGDRGSQVQPVQTEDLLDRPPRTLDPCGPRQLLAGKRVLVTGAGGTIGGELTRQVLTFGPERLILLDASEYNLYAIDRELREREERSPWTAELGDVRDRRRLETLFEAERPDVVLHAAALKHVPLMELNPCEAVLTNVIGAVNVARAARDRSQSLVFISTDKAVNPTNVMGATKRVAEQALQALARGHPVRAAAVRFGNVLGSAGSVVPLFERQIQAGGPLTVTDPAMERYFMTVQEAAALVLQAASLPLASAPPGSGQVFVLDMGAPVKIDDLARQLIRLHGLEPGRDIEIVYTGLRPGEKLYEEIFYDAETVAPTRIDGVLSAVEALPAWEILEAGVQALEAAATNRDQAEVIALLKALVPAFHPDGVLGSD